MLYPPVVLIGLNQWVVVEESRIEATHMPITETTTLLSMQVTQS